ncbi:hypothetical protein A3A05_01105 [Candidatus Nomurabacteria bacterium RIFCSPLOWO2_01_FULL_41_12]|uniref:YdbS-like PH domain-containing protein n=1 Tax=Candidatus Nomurabacteria bacterium RIFCSPLOWO2_01_FULL_41_12 TaxID=1801774 RepID=A0A1F6WXE6_9BACT|nr:MAG: hypothetical protein A2732_02495 [Candidatus Nomurabacteria bacterium RIFCSPHIGHO2_01_FULL_40_10]OGI86556.1 MAG: hypothetical protein A3A05_01105 [Candidatus Nomurabacteria bacterium RIFCSPLOWO2_01_FULL_41_12]
MKQLDPKAVWLFFISSVLRLFWLLILFSIVGSVTLIDYLSKNLNKTGEISFTFLNWLWIIIPIFLIICFILAKLTYHYYRYEMSELVFKKEHGIIWKKYVSIPYDRIQNVDIYRGVLARLLGLSDLQIQTAGGITAGSYGAFSEGRLIGVSKEEAEKLRDELIQKARSSRTGQGL